jgi:hypothetical protein
MVTFSNASHMRCAWSTTANILLCNASYSTKHVPWATFSNKPPAQILRSVHSVAFRNSSTKPIMSSNSASLRLAEPPDILFNKSAGDAETSAVLSSLTSTQLSRAAAQAVRLSITNGDLRNAYYIVNSLRLSLVRNKNSLVNIPGVRSQIARFDPIRFDRPVSPRLAMHALLHGLIRLGNTAKASHQAQLMMQSGFKVHPVSLDATMDSLLPKAPPHAAGPQRPKLDVSHYENPDILRLRPSIVSDQCTRVAIRLLLHSHHHRHQRSRNMYQSLINACLLQGEILVGSLLFAMVVQEWRVRRSITARLGNPCEESEPSVGTHSQTEQVRLEHARHWAMAPQEQYLHAIVSSIDEAISQGDPDYCHLLQALANLAMLLDQRQIPFPQISPLIRALYRCPRVDDHVWIFRRGVPTRVKAYSYFHGVLKRLLGSLPESRPSSSALNSRNGAVLPPLDLDAYNTLLHYALRHRYSPALANDVIQHMTTKRRVPLKPDVTTYNILLRSATLLRRKDIADYALAEIRRSIANRNNEITGDSTSESLVRDRESVRLPKPSKSQTSKTFHCVKSEKTDVSSNNETIGDSSPVDGDRKSVQLPKLSNSRLSGDQHCATKEKTDRSSNKHEIARKSTPESGVGITQPVLRSRIAKTLYRVKSDKMDLSSKTLDVPLKADSFTISTYLTHLTSTGQPHIVPRILFQLLPELAIIDHPSWGPTSVKERRRLSSPSHHARIKRAVSYGPYFFTTVLNAVCKAGKTGLAERVWLLAKEAERASWGKGFEPQTGPWCLPVHAYTSMITCYAAEARRGLVLQTRGKSTTRTYGDALDWFPKRKSYVRGWARFILTRNSAFRKSIRRGFAGHRMGTILFHSMKSGARAVYQALLRIKRVDNKWQNVRIPSPDARFFNAALDLFSRQPRMYVRGIRTARPYWRRRLRQSRTQYAHRGTPPRRWSAQLQSVAHQMVNAGYPLPPGLRYLFVGRWTPEPASERGGTQELDTRPYSFPLPQTTLFLPHAVPVVKTRGLPVRRRQRHVHLRRRPA